MHMCAACSAVTTASTYMWRTNRRHPHRRDVCALDSLHNLMTSGCRCAAWHAYVCNTFDRYNPLQVRRLTCCVEFVGALLVGMHVSCRVADHLHTHARAHTHTHIETHRHRTQELENARTFSQDFFALPEPDFRNART